MLRINRNAGPVALQVALYMPREPWQVRARQGAGVGVGWGAGVRRGAGAVA